MKMPYRLKYDPAFDIEKDIEQILELPPADGNVPPFKDEEIIKSNVVPFPAIRAYLLTKELEPIAIFDRLTYEGFGAFVKLVLCLTPQQIPNPDGYKQLDVMNHYRIGIRRKWIKRPLKLAFFVADKIYYHVSVPLDLALYLSVRFSEHDIIDRQFWDYMTE